jgi:hypothetical protein
MTLVKMALVLSLVTTGCAFGSETYTLPTERDRPVETFSAELRGPNYISVQTPIEDSQLWATVDLDDDDQERPGAARDVELVVNQPRIH